MENIKKRGKLYLIIGPMFSGKTSELIRRMRRYILADFKCLLIKFSKDRRYSVNKVASHDGKEMTALSTINLMNLSDLAVEYDIIGIDEIQFFSDLVQFCHKQLENGKTIVAAGLDATFKRTAFVNVLNLIPLSHTVDKLSAICMSCGNNASFSKRVGSETEVVVIGGLDKYMAVCRECYKLDCPPKSSPFQKMENNYINLPESEFMTNMQWLTLSEKSVTNQGINSK